MKTQKDLSKNNELCQGCFSLRNAPPSVSCLVLIKENTNRASIYELIPDKCPCKECIVKITCHHFCSLVHSKIKQIGTELNV